MIIIIIIIIIIIMIIIIQSPLGLTFNLFIAYYCDCCCLLLHYFVVIYSANMVPVHTVVMVWVLNDTSHG